MPIPKSILDRIIDSVEKYVDDHKEELMDQFMADGVPEKIHGEGEKTDQEAQTLWPEKPKVLVPIMKL